MVDGRMGSYCGDSVDFGPLHFQTLTKEKEMKLKDCYECGAKPIVERADGKIYVYCPICGASHASYGENTDMDHIASNWNEAMGWMDKTGIPTCSGCRPVGGACKECDMPL